jgi:cytochrome c-type biogenesis protein
LERAAPVSEQAIHRAFLARFRAHLGLVEKAMGALLVLTGIAFLTGAISSVSYWLLDTFPVLGKIG